MMTMESTPSKTNAAPQAEPVSLIGGRYRLLERLGAGGMGVVYAAHDRLTGRDVALKRVVGADAPQGVSTSGDLLTVSLAREFQLLASLRHPHIISVLDYGTIRTESGAPMLFYTMELLHGAQTLCAAARTLPTIERMRLLTELFEALVYLHRRGVLHCDLKPENVLVDSSGHVKVVDFGLSGLREQIESGAGGQIVGTLAFMAPELFADQPASVASDLYAAGLIAYEVLTGQFPYPLQPIGALISAIRTLEPDLMPLFNLTLPIARPVSETGELLDMPSLPIIVGRLLEKHPADRPASAAEVLAAMARSGLPVVGRSEAMRDSFLSAAAFVGRESEMAQLRAALEGAHNWEGSGWLIGGESGIGKSRLIDELRVYALIDGVQVLIGQAAEGGGLPYEMWREPLRRLALTTPLADREAAVLKALVPDLDALLERPVPPPPSLDGRAERRRLIRTIVELFERQTQPTLLILEDLHWARESLEVIEALLPVLESAPILIVGSYRLEERADLPAHLPGMHEIRLARLEPEQVAALSEAMLGEMPPAPLLELLDSETEGNVLFMIEMIRTLAEQSGGLETISISDSSPFSLSAGGILAILRRRLERLPTTMRPLLEAMAIAGRVLDRRVLEMLVELFPLMQPPDGLENWLLTCADSGVFEVFDEQWRFTHDKLREVLRVDVIERGALPDLSGMIALAIEAAYPDDEDRAERAALLADHWRHAGNRDREAAALEMAAQMALKNALYDQALEFAMRARPLVQGDRNCTVRVYAQSVEANYNLGRMVKARDEALRTLELLGFRVVESPERQERLIPVLRVRSGIRRLAARLPRSLRAALNHLADTGQTIEGMDDITYSVIALKMFERLTLTHYFSSQRTETAYYALLAINIGEGAAASRHAERLRGYASGAVALASSRTEQARAFVRRADRLQGQVQDANALVWYLLATGIFAVIQAEWDNAERRLLRCIEIASAIGDVRRTIEAYTTLTSIYYYCCNWTRAKETTAHLRALAERVRDMQGLAWAMDNEGRFALREGRQEEARAIFAEGNTIYVAVNDEANRLWTLGATAKSYLYDNNLDGARHALTEVIPGIRDIPQTSFGMLEPFSAAAAYALITRQITPQTVSMEAAAEAVAALGRYAGYFVLARPRYLAFMAWLRRLEGRTSASQRWAARAISEAARLHMPYDEALAHAELGYSLPYDDPHRGRAFQMALDIFDRIGAKADGDLLRARIRALV
jgi:predicted ATPase